MLLYTLGTWVSSVLLYYLILFSYMGIESGFGSEAIGFFILGLFYFIVCSLPSLVISLLITPLLGKISMPDKTKFGLWLFSAPVIVLLNILILQYIFFEQSLFTSDIMWLAMPAIVAVVIVILVGHKYFFKALLKSNPITEDNEIVT